MALTGSERSCAAPFLLGAFVNHLVPDTCSLFPAAIGRRFAYPTWLRYSSTAPWLQVDGPIAP